MILYGKEMAVSMRGAIPELWRTDISDRPAALFRKGSSEQHSGERRGTGTPWLNGLNILLPSEEKVKILHFCAILATFYTGYLADTCGIDNRDIGLNGYAIAVNPPNPNQYNYGAWFYNDKVMGIMCSPDHRHCAFAHEWFHILDKEGAKIFDLESESMTEGFVHGEFGPVAENIYFGQNAESFIASEKNLYRESLLAENYLNAHGSPTKPGALSSQLEMSARLFSAYVCTPNTTILGDVVGDRWRPGGYRIAPDTDELINAGSSLVGMAGACKEMGALDVLHEKSKEFEPKQGITAEKYDVGLINQRTLEEQKTQKAKPVQQKQEISFDEPEL